MSKPPPMDGVYNIPTDPDRSYTFYQSVEELPPQESFYRESQELASELRNAIASFLRQHNIPKYNEILAAVFGDDAIGEFPSDRTMCFFIGDLNAFVPELYSMLQKDILSRFPLWRLLAQYEELETGVYPGAVWFDNSLVTGSFSADHPVYQAWFDKAKNYRESRFGALARQLAYCRDKIPKAIERMADDPYVLIGAFGRYQPHLDGIAVWVLHPGSRDFNFDDEFSPVRTSAVSADGKIHPEFSELFYPKTNLQPPYWLKTQLVENRGMSCLVVKDGDDGNEIGRIEWDTILDDAQLS